jgi:dipeptidyl aminopeptidase/acylaminoacyl peptidase
VSIRRLVQLLFAMLALGLVSSAGATTPAVNGRIAYTSSQSGGFELFSVAPDGSAPRRLTYTTATEQSPAWSPDGTKIAYERVMSPGRFRIWVMNHDGGAQTEITPDDNSMADDTEPAWSPDGTLIAFASTRGGTWNLWVMNADGSGRRQVTTVYSHNPSWSPDGTQLAYAGLNGIGVVNAAGSNAHTISGPGNPASAPAWSRDGTRIAFARNNDAGYDGELYMVNADGSGEVQLTSGGFRNSRPAWSPDGTKIVFQRFDATGLSRLWTMDPDGNNAQQLTFGERDSAADWGTSQVEPVPTVPEAPIIDIYSPAEGIPYWDGVRNSNAAYGCYSWVSYIVSCQGDVPFGSSFDVSTPGTHTFTVRAVDWEGRTATKTVTYQVLDLVPPQITLRTPSDGATYELGSDVTVDYSCTDPGNGIDLCRGDLPNGSPLNTDSPGTRRFEVVALDKGGNVVYATATYTIVDNRPPRVIIQSPLEDHDYSLGSAWSTYYYCYTPANVRIVSCDGPVPAGALLDTASIGPHVFAVTATDANGKTATVSVPYRVIYLFKGFDSPVDTGGNLDGVRAGDSVALKFSLDGDHGLGVVTKTTWQAATCGDWIPSGPASPADGRVSYSASTDRYKEIVASSSSWRGSCRLLRFYLDDGTQPEVRVHFKK